MHIDAVRPGFADRRPSSAYAATVLTAHCRGRSEAGQCFQGVSVVWQVDPALDVDLLLDFRWGSAGGPEVSRASDKRGNKGVEDVLIARQQ